MGAPEYPGDGNDRENHVEPPSSQNLPMHGINPSEDEESDVQESEPAPFDPSQPYAAEGYHPLNFDGISASADEDDSEPESDEESTTNGDNCGAIIEEVETTAEREILSEIWNAPRSTELLDIELDNAKAEQIKSVMSDVSLKLARVQPPDWALNVPESKWIEKLLEDVRNKK